MYRKQRNVTIDASEWRRSFNLSKYLSNTIITQWITAVFCNCPFLGNIFVLWNCYVFSLNKVKKMSYNAFEKKCYPNFEWLTAFSKKSLSTWLIKTIFSTRRYARSSFATLSLMATRSFSFSLKTFYVFTSLLSYNWIC